MSIANKLAERIYDNYQGEVIYYSESGRDSVVVPYREGNIPHEEIYLMLVDPKEVCRIYSSRTINDGASGIYKGNTFELGKLSYQLAVIEFTDGSSLGLATSRYTPSSSYRDLFAESITNRLLKLHDDLSLEDFVKSCYELRHSL